MSETPVAGPRSVSRGTLSLRWRLLAATLVAVLVALLLAGVGLSSLFREHVMRQFAGTLTTQLDQLTARFDVGADGVPQIDNAALSDPRWSRPYSGLYWQLDGGEGAGPARGVLRSRSLWDTVLTVPGDVLADGAVHVHEVEGPGGAVVLVVERSVSRAEAPGARWRLMVAGELRDAEAALNRFNAVLAGSLGVLLTLLVAAAVAQVAVGLAPLRSLQRALAAVHDGRAHKLEGTFPTEVQPLIDDFNAVLKRHGETVERARTQAGNLAHAIKTPLSVLAQAADAAQRIEPVAGELPALVREQVDIARRQVDWHLARARAAATAGVPGVRAELAPVLDGLRRVMERVHATRDLRLVFEVPTPGLAFSGDAQDLQEMLGNLLDNACKWARQEVRVSTSTLRDDAGGTLMRVTVDDDGPGIDPTRRVEVMARGTRLDESVHGSGLGLSIARELATSYGGAVSLGAAPLGGVRAQLDLPADFVR